MVIEITVEAVLASVVFGKWSNTSLSFQAYIHKLLFKLQKSFTLAYITKPRIIKFTESHSGLVLITLLKLIHNIGISVKECQKQLGVILAEFRRDTVTVFSEVNYRSGCYSTIMNNTIMPLTHVCQSAHTQCCSCSAVPVT